MVRTLASAEWVRRAKLGRSGFSIAIVLAILGTTGTAMASPTARNVDGRLETRVVPPPTCTSVVAVCTHGRIDGDVRGTFDVTGDALLPAHQANAAVTFYAGQVVIRTDDGNIVGTDAGAIDFSTGAFVDLTTISAVRSTGRWTGVTGQLRFSGSCDLAAGVCSEYAGTLQRP